MHRSLALFIACQALAQVGCGHGSETKQLGGLPRTPPYGAPLAADSEKTLPLAAHRFAEVTDVIGPYVGRDGELSLAAWAEASRTGRKLVVATIDAKGVPSAPTTIGNVSADLDLVLVRGFGSASAKLTGRPRFALITTRKSGQKTLLDVTAIAAGGSALWGPTTLAERAANVLWLGFVIANDTPLLLWAEQADAGKPGDPAAIYGLPLSLEAKPQPFLVATKACAWQAASVGTQAALASVKASSGSCTAGSVTLDLLSKTGRVDKSLELPGRAALDLDLIGGDDAFVLAWSDHAQLEPRVMTAVVDARGALRSTNVGTRGGWCVGAG